MPRHGKAPSFFWIPSLSEADPLHILPVISALTTYVVSAQTPEPAPQPTEEPAEQTGVFSFSAATPIPEDPDAPPGELLYELEH